MQVEKEIVIIGGGLAGLTAALHLKKLNFNVTLIEKNTYPHHKVCGEYVSNEVIPYLEWLGISFDELKPAAITELHFTSVNGKSIKATLPLGGFGLSRYAMDHFLYLELVKRGVTVIQNTVLDVSYNDDIFKVSLADGKDLMASQVIGAFGKRSLLDVKLHRNFIQKLSPYIAVKAHYKAKFQTNLVGLHNFKGGYCGVSKVESGAINICYLATYESFKRYKNIAAYQQNVIYENKYLKDILENAEMIFEAPLSISQISFQPKEPVLDHMLMIGDTAGLIHPLCGNGMAMAIHSAKIVSESIDQFMGNKNYSRSDLEHHYSMAWRANFASRIRTGRLLSSVLKNEKLQSLAINTLSYLPSVLQNIIKNTHGKPITMP